MEITHDIDSNDYWQQLKQSIGNNLSWQPAIYIRSTHFYHPLNEKEVTSTQDICVIDKTRDQCPQLVNLALFLDVSVSNNSSLAGIRSEVLGYPPNAVLELEYFHGLEAANTIVNALKNAAAAGGTILVVEKVRKSGSIHRLKEIFLVCDHYRQSRGQHKKFEEGKHQLAGSVLQEEHGHCYFSNNNDDNGSNTTVKIKRKVTSVRATSSSDRCAFGFTIFCSAVNGSKGKWYVAMAGNKCKEVRCKHSNHLPVNQLHLAKSFTSIPDTVKEEIRVKIQSGVTPSAIATEIREIHNLTISQHQIHSMKKQIIHDLIRSAGENPSYSAAERLIQVFKTYTDVSYVYVRHHMQTGFVTYMKSRGSSQQLVQRDSQQEHQAGSLEEVTAWRNELVLGENNEILVAFAWSHNEESRKLCMFPEFTALDLTFGVNRQKRPLLVVSGADGENKSFTAFRCFMPSKTKQAYKWALHIALPLVNGQDTINRMQCISSDNEEALEQAIEESRHHPGGLPRHIMHRLDFYHLFLQPWNQYCNAPSDATPEVRSALDTVKEWVYSWVTSLETKEEFHHSLQRYNLYSFNQ